MAQRLAQRWHNVGTTLAQCGIGNGEPTLAQRSKLRCANLRCDNGAGYVGPTLGQPSCAIWGEGSERLLNWW